MIWITVVVYKTGQSQRTSSFSQTICDNCDVNVILTSARLSPFFLIHAFTAKIAFTKEEASVNWGRRVMKIFTIIPALNSRD